MTSKDKQQLSIDALTLAIAKTKSLIEKKEADSLDESEARSIENREQNPETTANAAENARLKLTNQKFEQEIFNLEADRELRKEYSSSVFCYLICYSIFIAIILFFQGFSANGFHLDTLVMTTLAGSTAVAAIGLVGLVVSGLFKTSETQNKRKSKINK